MNAMGKWDRKNWLIIIKLRDNLTDRRMLEFIGKDRQFSYKEYKKFESTLAFPLYTEKAEQIVRFFIEYHNGELMPDRYSSADPIRSPFTLDALPKAIENLCWPGGSLCLKKSRKYEAEIENEEFGLLFTEGEYIVPVVEPSEFRTTITLYFSKTIVKDGSSLFSLADDIAVSLSASKGCVIDQEDLHVIYECNNLEVFR